MARKKFQDLVDAGTNVGWQNIWKVWKGREPGMLENLANWFSGNSWGDLPPGESATDPNITTEEAALLKKALVNWLSNTAGGMQYQADVNMKSVEAFKSRLEAVGVVGATQSKLVNQFKNDDFTTKDENAPHKGDALLTPLHKAVGNNQTNQNAIKAAYASSVSQPFAGDGVYEYIQKYAGIDVNPSGGDTSAKVEEAKLKELDAAVNQMQNNPQNNSNDGTPLEKQNRENTTADYVNALQCALMSELTKLADFRKDGAKGGVSGQKGWDEKYAYGARIVNVDTKNPEGVINDMMLPRYVATKGTIPNAFFANLGGYGHVFLVDEDGKERLFPNQLGVGLSNVNPIAFAPDGETEIDKQGNSSQKERAHVTVIPDSTMSLESMKITYEGGTPATARSDVAVALTYKFKGLAVLEIPFVVRDYEIDEDTLVITPDISGKVSHTVRPMDLITVPLGLGDSSGNGKMMRRQYNPDYGRLRIKYGTFYYDSSDSNKITNKIIEMLREDQPNFPASGGEARLKEYGRTEYHLDLCIVDHELSSTDAKKDEWTLTLNYRGYIQQYLTSPIFDAMQSKEDLKELQEKEEEINKKAADANCSASQRRILQRQFNGEIASRRVAKYRNIMKRLIKQNLTLSIDVKNETLDNILRQEFDFETQSALAGEGSEEFNTASIQTDSGPDPAGSDPPALTAEEQKALDDKKNKQGLKDAKSREGKTPIPFFFLGDVLRVSADAIFDDTDGGIDPNIAELNNNDFRFIACPFAYKNPKKPNSTTQYINITEIPISSAFFQSWFHENVVKKNKEFYPIGTFIRDLCEVAMSNLLSEYCFGDSLEPKIHYTTTFHRAKKITHSKSSYKKPRSSNNRALLQPAATGEAASSFFIIHPMNQNYFSLVDNEAFNPKDHRIPYLPFGRRCTTGPVKSANFNKQNAPYQREARFANSSQSGLTLLSNVYDVTLNLNGVFDYYPGSIIYIDPVDLTKGKPSGQPSEPYEEGSFSFVTGLGGYHCVTSCTVDIKDLDKDNGISIATTVVGKWVYSGVASETRPNHSGNKSLGIQSDKKKESKECENLINAGRVSLLQGIEPDPPEEGEPPE
jgi:hypothetical protein